MFFPPMYELGELEKLPTNRETKVILKYGEMGPSRVKTHSLRREESLPNTS